MNLAARRPLIFNLLDREAVKADWRKRFENRQPPGAGREPGKLQVAAGVKADTTEILLFDEIGYWGVTAKQFNEALAQVTTPNIVVRINSPGGDVFDGFAIYTALLNHPAKVETRIEGLAASAASFIALAGDKVVIAEAAMMMVHKAWGLAIGNADDFMAMAATLEKIDGNIAGIYARKSGKPPADMLALMAAETWLDAEESKGLGLADEILAKPAEESGASNGIAEADLAILARMRGRLALAERE